VTIRTYEIPVEIGLP